MAAHSIACRLDFCSPVLLGRNSQLFEVTDAESIFREASDTLSILLWQQARIGIGQGTDGSELPPALLSRHDRHVLKSGFRSILRLLEFTGDSPWSET